MTLEEEKRKKNTEAKREERKRKRAAGLVPLDIWAPKVLHQTIKDFVAKIIKKNS